LWWIRKERSCISRRAPLPSTQLGPILLAAGRRIRNSSQYHGTARISQRTPATGENNVRLADARGSLPYLRRTDFADFQFQRRPAFSADQRAVIHHVNRVGPAAGAFRGGVGGVRQWIGRSHTRDHSAFSLGLRLECSTAASANVVVTAIRRTRIKHFARTAYRTWKFQFARLHSTFCPC